MSKKWKKTIRIRIGFNDQMIGDRLDITRDMIRKWREKNNLPANRTHKRSFKHSIEIN